VADEFEQYKVKEEPDEFEQYRASPKGDTTPTGYSSPDRNLRIMSSRTPTTVDPTSGMPAGKPVEISQDEQNKELASQQGVVIPQARLPFKVSVISGLAANPDEKNAFLMSYVSKAHEGAPVRIGPTTGQVEFLNGQNKWELAEPGAARHLAEIPENVLATGGAVGGTALGALSGNPAVAAGAGSLGAGVGETVGNYVKNKTGQLFGINNSISDPRLASHAAMEGTKTGLTDLSLNAAYGIGRGAKTWLFGRQVLTPAKAAELSYAQKRSEQLINEINKESGGVEFKPFTGQIGEHTEPGQNLLAAGAQAINDPKHGHALNRQIERSEDALVNYFDNTTLPFRMDGVTSASEGGAPLEQAIAGERQSAQQPLVAAQANAQDAAATKMAGIQSQSPAPTGRAIRDSIAAKYQQAKATRQQAYADYQNQAGYDPVSGQSRIEVPITPQLRAQQDALSTAYSNALLTGSRTAKARAMLDIKDKDTLNLSQIDDTLRWVRKEIRSKDPNPDNKMSIFDAKRLEASLTDMRDSYLQKNEPDAYDALTKAEAAKAQEANTFQYGLTKNLLKPDGNGQYKLSDAKVITTILRNKDPDAAGEIAAAIKSNPEALSQAQNYLFALYRKRVAKDAEGLVPDYKKHVQFMNDYGPVIDKFFTPAQQTQIRELGGFSEAIQSNMTKLRELNSIWKKDFKGQLENFSAEGLVNKTLGPNGFSNDEVKKLVTVANAYGPDVMNPWRAGIAEKLRERIMTSGQDRIDGQALDNLLSDKDAVLKLQTIFGPRYINSLETLQKGTQLARTTPRDIKAPTKNNWWSDTVRTTVAPPLSREGRLVSLGQNSRARAYVAKVSQALADPGELERLANTTRRTMLKVGFINSAGTVTQLKGEDDLND
jgi:hypothetical protein